MTNPTPTRDEAVPTVPNEHGIMPCKCGSYPTPSGDGARPDDGYRTLWCQSCQKHVTEWHSSEDAAIRAWNEARELDTGATSHYSATQVEEIASAPAPASGGVDAVARALRQAADEAYRVCAETRHVSLGDKARDAILALSSAATSGSEAGGDRFKGLMLGQNPAEVWRAQAYKLAAELDALAKPASSPAGGDVREALAEAIEFADQDFHALTPAGVAMIERWRTALSQSTSAATPVSEAEPVAWATKNALEKLKRGSPTTVEPAHDVDYGAMTPLYLAKPASSPAGGDVVREALEKVRRWAESRCPCHNDEPNPCPLCGASVENLEACKSAENTLPRELLTTIRAALSRSDSGGRVEE